eukprot:TRINITY_DN8358_c0_g2_i4.p1 TRINITY_DN8358_c0_g2~~TRINITY_DN8358_c0_g2_i4.p1  ORF type:complete len:137 (-),score=28.27 TRINITY_DN8358_c0_g2_i4:20-430(-)
MCIRDRCKCHRCDEKLQKGALCLGVRGPSVKSTAWHHVGCVARMMDPEQLRAAGIDLAEQFNPWWISNYGSLDPSQKQQVADSLGCKARVDDGESEREHDTRMAREQEKENKLASKAKRKRSKGTDRGLIKTCRYG